MPETFLREIQPPPPKGTCPTCSVPAPTSPRYPIAVCGSCVKTATCALPEHAGRVVTIGDPSKSYTGPMIPGHELDGWTPCGGGSGQRSAAFVVVRGVDCVMAEAHFGGTVVVPR